MHVMKMKMPERHMLCNFPRLRLGREHAPSTVQWTASSHAPGDFSHALMLVPRGPASTSHHRQWGLGFWLPHGHSTRARWAKQHWPMKLVARTSCQGLDLRFCHGHHATHARRSKQGVPPAARGLVRFCGKQAAVQKLLQLMHVNVTLLVNVPVPGIQSHCTIATVPPQKYI